MLHHSPLAAVVKPRSLGIRMLYPHATAEQIDFFNQHGWLVVEDAIPQKDLDELEHYCDLILTQKEKLAYDWAWDAKEDKENRSFRIVQSSPSLVWAEADEAAYRKWLVAFGSELTGLKLEFWYDQFLGKPPGMGAATPWHQDEAYWGRRLWDRGITCWMSTHDVNPANGCMHFVRGGHRELLNHRNPPEMASDLLVCEPGPRAEVVVCPIKAGSVTFHHSKTPHMTTGNTSDQWRLTLAQHFWNPLCKDLPQENYKWRVMVDQKTNERVFAETGAIEKA
jgi:hypothetical protein